MDDNNTKENTNMTKPLVAATLPGGRVRVYFDGEPDAAFWAQLGTLAEMMAATLPKGSPAETARSKPKKPRRQALGSPPEPARAAPASAPSPPHQQDGA